MFLFQHRKFEKGHEKITSEQEEETETMLLWKLHSHSFIRLNMILLLPSANPCRIEQKSYAPAVAAIPSLNFPPQFVFNSPQAVLNLYGFPHLTLPLNQVSLSFSLCILVPEKQLVLAAHGVNRWNKVQLDTNNFSTKNIATEHKNKSLNCSVSFSPYVPTCN